ncbi:MAG: BamA/TamA family outer membrane protein [Ferruginibacter sp.]
MKITISTGLSAKRNMNINTRQRIVDLLLKIAAPGTMKNGTGNILRITVLCVFCLVSRHSFGQKTTRDPNAYILVIRYKDSLIAPPRPVIKTSFTDLLQVSEYINDLPRSLATKGYPVASVDSVWQDKNFFHIALYLGTKYNWVQLRAVGIDRGLLTRSGYIAKNFADKPMNIAEVDVIKERLLTAYENEGFPFATVYLDSVVINEDKISAVLMANKGLLYRIDSIKNYGKLRLNRKFLQQYLTITNGSIYSREKLKDVDRRMLELPFAETIQPSTLNMLGSGSILNLYVDNKKSSEASAIFGFLPDANNTGKFQLTGDVNLDLKNVFGAGEGLLIKYQALQPKSPRLNLGYDKPYILHSAFGLGFLFELFKKDSSFLRVNAQLGLGLNLSAYQTGKAVVQWETNSLLQEGIDTGLIKLQKRLPENIDVRSVNAGITYEFRKTNYRFNPRSGNEAAVTLLAGIKNIQKNNEILALKSPGFNFASLYDSVRLRSYQLRLKAAAAHYFPLGKRGVFKAGLNGGLYNSPNIFRNELYQIGGYRLLRGFDEESIYASQYAVITAEYRSIIDLNSYIFGFIDAAAVKAKYRGVDTKNIFTGAGLGIVYQTKAGLLNLSLAVGKRDDLPFNIRQAAKIHFGYINYF